jgi:hypothetical protein
MPSGRFTSSRKLLCRLWGCDDAKEEAESAQFPRSTGHNGACLGIALYSPDALSAKEAGSTQFSRFTGHNGACLGILRKDMDALDARDIAEPAHLQFTRPDGACSGLAAWDPGTCDVLHGRQICGGCEPVLDGSVQPKNVVPVQACWSL